MTDAELIDALADLGITPQSWRAILLLPLVRIAWADGLVQGPESEMIRTTASQLGVTGPAWEVVARWLERGPDPAAAQRGQAILLELAGRHRGLGADLPHDVLNTLQRQCEAVARAAGGLFGILHTVEPSERKVLAELTEAIREASEVALADLPTPSSGTWEDL